MKSLDVIIPIYNEDSCIEELLKRLRALREDLKDEINTNFIFVNDGSSDRSYEILNKYASNEEYIKVINFSRNFGHQIAVTAGIDNSNADYLAIIDADLQDPPEIIKDMYKKSLEGYDIVYGKRLKRKKETAFKKLTAFAFYRILNFMCELEIPTDTGDFRLITKRVADIMKQMPEKDRFLRGMIPWTGFSSTPIYYNRDERYAGVTKYSVRKMIKFAIDAILSFSNKPLRIASVFALTLFSISAILFLALIYIKLFTDISLTNTLIIISTILLVSSMQMFLIGIIGEYIARIYEADKKRPMYIIESTQNI